MPPFATVEDVEAVWRPLTGPEWVQADIHLGVASAIIRRRFAGIDRRVSTGSLNPALPAHVAVMMVKRLMQSRSPEEPTEEQIGEARQRWDADRSEALDLTDDEIALLTPPTVRRSRTMPLGMGLPLP